MAPFLGVLAKGVGKLLGGNLISNIGSLVSSASGLLGLFNKDARKSATGSGLTTAQIQQNDFNADQARLSWERSEQSADAAMARQRELRQTAIGDTVQSAQAAGINPIFAVSGGMGASASSAPQGSSSAASGSAPQANVSALMDMVFAKQRFDATRAEIKQMKSTAALNEANANKANADAENIRSQKEGQDISNRFAAETFEARKRSIDILNNLNDAKISEVFAHRDELVESAHLAAEQADTEATKRLYNEAAAMAQKGNLVRLLAMLPYEQEVASATVAEKRAVASAQYASAAYTNGLISAGMIQAAVAQARADARQGDAVASAQEVEAALKQWDLDLKSGKPIDAFDAALGGPIGGLVQALNIIAQPIRGIVHF